MRRNVLRIVTLALSLAVASWAPTVAVADDSAITARIKSGRAKSQGCTRCHGRNGIQRLAVASGFDGTVGGFVTVTLTELRDGIRHHNIMSGIAAPLSDEDIGDIAAWAQSLADKSAKN